MFPKMNDLIGIFGISLDLLFIVILLLVLQACLMPYKVMPN